MPEIKSNEEVLNKLEVNKDRTTLTNCDKDWNICILAITHERVQQRTLEEWLKGKYI